MQINPQTQTKVNGRLAVLIDAIGAYGPPFAFLIAFGYGVMYYVARQQGLGTSPTQLIILAITAGVIGILYLPVQYLRRNGWVNVALALVLLPYVSLLVAAAFVFNGISIICGYVDIARLCNMV
jgi:hypothetical protein